MLSIKTSSHFVEEFQNLFLAYYSFTWLFKNSNLFQNINNSRKILSHLDFLFTDFLFCENTNFELPQIRGREVYNLFWWMLFNIISISTQYFLKYCYLNSYRISFFSSINTVAFPIEPLHMKGFRAFYILYIRLILIQVSKTYGLKSNLTFMKVNLVIKLLNCMSNNSKRSTFVHILWDNTVL